MAVSEIIFRFVFNILSIYTGFRTIDLFLVQKKIRWEKRFGLYFIIWLINSALYAYGAGIAIVRISIIIGYFCVAYFLHEGSWKIKALATIGALALGVVSEDVVWILSNFLGKPIEYEAMGCLCSSILILLLILLLERLKVSATKTVIPASACWNMVLLFFGSICLAEIMSEKIDSYEWATTAVVLISLINLGTFHVYHKVAEKYEEKLEQATILQESRMYLKQLELLEQSQQNVRIMRHDLKNHLQLISAYLENGEYQKAADYVESLEEIQSVKGEYVKTGNVEVDSILNYKLELIEKQTGCKPQIRVDIPKESLMSGVDFNTILGNLLDNAQEALRTAKEKYLDIQLKYEQGNLYLSVYNSYDGTVQTDKKSRLKTRKLDAENHGYGLHSVERIVKKYNGVMKTSCDEKLFHVDLILMLQK